MGNQIFRDRLENTINHALMEARTCSRLEHPGLVGRVRQIMVEHLLQPLLPEGFHIGTGKIADAKGNLSAEADVIIYDRRSTIPPVLFGGKDGVFPVETVYYSIEVKSKLNAGKVADTLKKGAKLRSLFGGHFPHSAVFAFESDLTSSPEAERFIQPQKDLSVPLPVNIFCVAGRQYGYWNGVWKLTGPEMTNTAVLNFLVGILNTLVESAQKPRVALPPGWYFYPEVEMPTADRPV